MADYSVTKEEVTGIANAIRSKGGTSATLEFPTEFETAITNLPSGGECPEKKILNDMVEDTLTEFTYTGIGKNTRYYMLARENNLVTVNFPNATHIRPYALYRCPKLTTVTAPLAEKVDYEVFARCSALQRIVLPKCNFIGSACFDRCTALTYIDIGGSDAYFEDRTFITSGVNTLILRGNTVPTTQDVNMLYETPIASGTGYIYVPKALVDQYKAAPNWATYANQIRAIEDYPDITGG